MTRLFIRFYLGVVLILFAAFTIQMMLFRMSSRDDNLRIAEETLGGGLRLARDVLQSTPDADRAAALDSLREKFGHPIEMVPGEEVPERVNERFAGGDDVVFHFGDGIFLLAPLSDGKGALRFGPLPTFVGPSQTNAMIGLAMLLLLIAIAIALLLRPVSKQLRLLERAATAIAAGNFSTRVDERKASSARTLAHAFNNMADRTESLLRTQRELLQAVSHELRTPLSRIHFAIDLIRTAGDDRQLEQRLQSLDTAAQELDDLVGELLRYVRLETSEPLLGRDEVDLLCLAKELIEEQSLVHPEKQFEIGPRLAGGDAELVADRVSVKRALGNLLANAARFGKRRVVIDVAHGQDGWCIDVDDDGPGIPAEDRARVFEPFVRLEQSGRGAGLGLALVRRIVAHYGGTVEAQASPLGGCRIHTVWPTREAPSPPDP
jgi:two-component system sensor histidine kinase RstB